MKVSVVIVLCAVILAASVTAGHAQAPPGNWCGTTPDPQANSPDVSRETADTIAGINQARAAEGLSALVLPPNYAQLPDDQKVIVLINLERTARGLSAFDSGNPQLSGNDPVLGYAATNHSALLQQSLAQHPGFNNPVGIYGGLSTLHENSIEGPVWDRLTALPGVQGGADTWGEIIAYVSPEFAVYQWMYQDSGANWGHRRNILGIKPLCFTNAGAGFAPPMGGLTQCRPAGAQPAPTESISPCIFVPNTGPNLYTVEFIKRFSAGGSNGYTPPVISAAAPAPAGQRLLRLDAAPSSPQPDSTAVQLSATYDATVYGLPNDIRPVWIYPTATWGKQANCPEGTTCPALMGQLPFGAGAFPCPVTKGTDPNIPSYSCTASVPNGSGPLGTGPVIVALDNYGNALYIDASYINLRAAP
jgi:hypothetical protein